VRAIGSANGANPVPIIVPCHRVVAGNGEGGYSLGIAMKRALLAHEARLSAAG
jgi:methylated-DNA-[protein]-cysteine S-methyltransferase